MKTPGQIASEAQYKLVYLAGDQYAEANWNVSPPDVKERWEEVARAVIDAQLCVHPWKDVFRDKIQTEPIEAYAMVCHRCGKEL